MTVAADPAADRGALHASRAGHRRVQVQIAAVVVVGLAVLGAVLGLVWAWWSPQRPPGVELPAGTVQINESEAFAAADMRFAIITGLIGLAVGIVLWFRRDARGPILVVGLALGGLAGAGLTSLVGNLVGGGTNHGRPNTEIPHLPLSVHLHGLYYLEPLVAVLAYSAFVAFAVADDLGRPDPVRDMVRRAGTPVSPREWTAPDQASVQPQYLAEHGGADRDGPGFAQQDQFPSQDPGQGA